MLKRTELERVLKEMFHYENFQDHCQNGIQVEGKEGITKIVFGVSFNLPLLEKAIDYQADAIIVHHGFFGKTFFSVKGVMKEKIRLLLDHNIGYTDEPEIINIKHIGEKYFKKGAYAWGFYHTVTTNLSNIKKVLSDFEELTEEQRDSIRKKIEEMLTYFESIPKNRSWKGRAKIGTAKKWYRPVETTQTVGEFGIFSGKHLLDKPKT